MVNILCHQLCGRTDGKILRDVARIRKTEFVTGWGECLAGSFGLLFRRDAYLAVVHSGDIDGKITYIARRYDEPEIIEIDARE